MKTLVVAGVTVREMLSRKVQVNLLLFGLLLLLASYVGSYLTIGEQHRIIADLGLSAMALVTTLLATFLGAGVVAGDLERRVVYAVVAKPISRTSYLLGRYLGLAAALLLNVAAMAALLALLLCWESGDLAPLSPALGAAVVLVGAQALVVAGLAVFFSAFTTTTLAAIFTLTLAAAGHLTGDMRAFWKGGNLWLAQLVWHAVPDMSALTLNAAVVYRVPVGAGTFLPVLYALAYAATALALGAVIFERREFR